MLLVYYAAVPRREVRRGDTQPALCPPNPILEHRAGSAYSHKHLFLHWKALWLAKSAPETATSQKGYFFLICTRPYMAKEGPIMYGVC